MRNKLLEKALYYTNTMNFSVIPLLPNKKPLLAWEPWQHKKATDDEVTRWWTKYPDSMIGIITGEVSNLTVIDVDNEDGKDSLYELLPNSFQAPIAHTPRGGFHLYCRYHPDLRNNSGAIKGCDLRSEGGYVVAPPSINDNGKFYQWDKTFRLETVRIPQVPVEYVTAIKQLAPEINYRVGAPAEERFRKGRRDEDLFNLANHLIKGGMPYDKAEETLLKFATICDPPFPEEEAMLKVQSALHRDERRKKNVSFEVEEFVQGTSGWFNITDLYKYLGMTSAEEKGNVKIKIYRLIESGVLEKFGKRDGQYRRIEREVEEMDFRTALTDDLPIKFPLEVEDWVKIYPGNVIIVAGDSNAGKTAFFLDFIRLNMDRHDIHYFNSEMGAGELRLRLSLFEDTALEDWKFRAVERSGDFSDVIQPDSINIIDFLEVVDEFWRVGGQISAIHEALGKGIAIIGLQKNYGRELGRGGALSIEKPRLYLAMERGRMKIVKAKNYRGAENPNGYVRDFKLVQGSTFITQGFWHKPLDKERLEGI